MKRKTDNRYSVIYALFVALIVFLSCETPVDLPDDFDDPKVVVTSFISPQDSLIQVFVSLQNTFSSTSNEFEVIENAIVDISDGASTMRLPFNTDSLNYIIPVSDFPIVSGRTYTLNVRVGETLLTANTTVPVQKVDNIDISIREGTSASPWGVSISWDDLLNQDNFYRVGARGTFSFEFRNLDSLITGSFESSVNFDITEEYKNDENIDGQRLTSAGDFSVLGVNTPESSVDLDTLRVHLVTGTEEYHSYNETLRKGIDIDDFFSEPLPLPGNIRGGLGIFAAYQIHTIVIIPE